MKIQIRGIPLRIKKMSKLSINLCGVPLHKGRYGWLPVLRKIGIGVGSFGWSFLVATKGTSSIKILTVDSLVVAQ